MIKKKQILVVEDNIINREILVEILSEEYHVLEAGNGQEALDILQKYKGDIDLILLDVQMPVMDGYTFLEHKKEVPEFAMIPVIVVTQGDKEEDEVHALSHGASDFVPKPYRPQIILHRVASIIKLRETAAMANQFKYDRITGIYSLEYFCQRVHDILLQNPHTEYDIICSDIESFKLYNDAFGIQAGNHLLREVANFFKNHLARGGLCGRVGADKFACLTERKIEYADEIFEQLGERINQLPDVHNITMKYGIFRVTDSSLPVEQMCDRAGLAANAVKGQYDRHFSIYDDTLRDKLLWKQNISALMQEALDKKQFTIYLQPKYSLNDVEVVGAEALVRWTHPELGFISPGDFIPLFEQNGFITQLDRYVWEQVCETLQKWDRAGYRKLPLSVNVSRRDIYQTDLIETLLELTGKYGVDPKYLHLEITESAYTENPKQIISTVEELHKAGFVIEMDDFGSGYSSLNMLSDMQIDVLKLDIKFMQNETAKQADRGILRFVIEMARRMNLRVVAEGVETREQMEELREIECDYAQGYYFARPMPIKVFEESISKIPVTEKSDIPEREYSTFQKECLLLVEENEYKRKLEKEALEDDYCILEAQNAEEAISLIDTRGCEIDVAVLSMTLPGQGSKEVLKELRAASQPWHMPILGVAPPQMNMKKLGNETDIDDVFYKPRDQLCRLCIQKRIWSMMALMKYQRNEKSLLQDSCCDFMTGLLNRRGLQDAMEKIHPREFPIGFYLFDLDNLKQINDCCGHEAGDQMIVLFGDILRRYTRSSDLLGRYGGDEFIAILKNIPSEEFVLKKGEEISRIFKNTEAEGLEILGCSVGAVICESKDKLSEEIFRMADRALYYSKQHKKGRCSLWNENMK